MNKNEISEKRKRKIKDIIYYVFWFVISGIMAWILYDLFTWNKYTTVPNYKTKALILSIALPYLFMFGNAVRIKLQEDYIEKLENILLKK